MRLVKKQKCPPGILSPAGVSSFTAGRKAGLEKTMLYAAARHA